MYLSISKNCNKVNIYFQTESALYYYKKNSVEESMNCIICFPHQIVFQIKFKFSQEVLRINT